MIKVAVCGSNGKMGQEVVKAVSNSEDMSLVAQVDIYNGQFSTIKDAKNSVDIDVLIDDFMNAYYKEAAPYVREYYDIIRRHYQSIYNDKGSECAGCRFVINDATIWNKKVMDDILSVLDMGMQALKKSDRPESEKEELIERVHKDWFLMKYNEVKFFGSYYNANELAEINAMLDEYWVKYDMKTDSD